MMQVGSILLRVALGSGGDAVPLVNAGSAATVSQTELRARLLEAGARVRSLSVTYETTGYDSVNLPSDAYFHSHLVAQAPCFFLLESGHGRRVWSWEDDPYRQLDVLDETHSTAYFPRDRTFLRREFPRDAGLPGTLQTELVLIATGLWPCSDRQPPTLQGFPTPLSVVASDANYRLRETRESVNGALCYVLDRGGRDILWIDLETGARIAKRETHSIDPAHSATRLELRDPFQVADGIWIPRVIETNLVLYDERGETKAEKHGHVRVLEASVEAVPESAFHLTLPSGSLEMPLNGEPKQVVAGGTDLIAEIAAWSARMNPDKDAGRTAWSAEVSWIDAAAAVVGLAAALLAPLPRRRGRRTGSEARCEVTVESGT